MKIVVIVPIISSDVIKFSRNRIEPYVRPETQVDFINVEYGPASIESVYDDVFAAPFVVKKAEWAEKNGYNAVVVSCMLDPGVEAAKEAVDIPVVGPKEAANAVANLLGKNVAHIYPEGLTVIELSKNPKKTYDVLLSNAKMALKDGADVLILDCTGLTGYAKKLQKDLSVPVLEGEGLALSLAQMLVDVGLTQSKLAHPKPSKKRRTFPILD
jgi:allantoin racemase